MRADRPRRAESKKQPSHIYGRAVFCGLLAAAAAGAAALRLAQLGQLAVRGGHKPVSYTPLGANCDPLALLPIDALRMATVNGGNALGLLTVRIEGCYDADLILVDFSHLNLTPCHSVISNLAYAAHGSDVCMNMARGKVIYRDGDFLTIDIDRVKREVADYALPLLFETK